MTPSRFSLSILLLALAGCDRPPVGVLPAGRLVLPPALEEAAVPVVAAAVPTAPAATSPAAGGATSGSGHSGGGVGPEAPPSRATFEGKVVGLAGNAEVPLAGAVVTTSDGRATQTDAQGRFTMPGTFPADGAFAAGLAGYVASAVVGLDASAPLTLHLKAQSTVSTGPVLERLTAHGRLVGPDGAPRPNMTVVLESAAGAFSAPTTTDDSGDFSLVVFAPGGRVEDGTLLAVGDATNAWMGMATGVALSAADTALDFDATVAGPSPLRVVAATHPLALSLDATLAGAPANASLELRGPGASLSLPLDAQNHALIADLPGATFALEAEAVNAALGTTSRLDTGAIAVDFGAASTAVYATMLAPPAVPNDNRLVAGETLHWEPVPGANAYTLQVAGLDDQGFVWEGFTTGESTVFGYDGAIAPGSYGLTITAWDDAALTARAVASVGPARLRILPLSGAHRRSSRQIRCSVS